MLARAYTFVAMPYLTRIHEQQDPEYKYARDMKVLFALFYRGVQDSAFRGQDEVSDELVFFLQTSLTPYNLFAGVSTARFHDDMSNPVVRDNQAPARPPARE